MSESKGLRLKSPTPLPQGPVSKIAFKVFLNQLRAYLEQDQNNYMFLPEGCYSTWHPRQEGRRLQELSDDDADNQKLIRQAAANGRNDGIDLPTEQTRLLLSRNSQLSKFITLIAILCHYTEQDDINNCSTSWDWILTYLRQHYNLESRGEHFLDIAGITYNSDLPYQTYYKQFRASFLDNLRRQGDRLAYKNNQILNEDENMSPTLEATIVLWTLERIDPRLPLKVKKNYGHQMVGDQCLVSLQSTIFQNIGTMLSELDATDNALAARCEIQTNECNMVALRRQDKTPGRSSKKKSFQQSKTFTQRRQPALKKYFCRLCYHAGASSTAYTSHPISSCTYLTRADKNDLRGLNAMETLSINDTGTARTAAYVAPGWDTEESDSEQNESDGINIEINDNNYVASIIPASGHAQSNTLIPVLNNIQPIPSQILLTHYNGHELPITLDSGATISFIKREMVCKLGLPIKPNNQTATLADMKTIIKSVGEIDVLVTHNLIPIRLRALIVEDLQALCFGGTNFHVDNEIVPDICKGTIMIKGKCFKQHNLQCLDTPSMERDIKSNTPSRPRCVQVKSAQVILPGGELPIPISRAISGESIFVTPTFPGVDPHLWPTQLCQLSGGCALYVNRHRDALIHSPKNAHFTTTEVGVAQPEKASWTLRNSPELAPLSVNGTLKNMKINSKLLSAEQYRCLETIHRNHIQVFDNDMTGGYNHAMGNFEVSFVFKETSSLIFL